MSSKVLWTNRESGRSFLIPKGFVLPGGDFEIFNPDDHAVMVEENSIIEYEASEKDIEAHNAALADAVFGDVGNMIGELFRSGKEALAGIQSELKKTSTPSEEEKSTTDSKDEASSDENTTANTEEESEEKESTQSGDETSEERH